jgi:SSS family solute:Na+ symporter
MTFSSLLPEKYSFLRSPVHESMIIVIGTMTIFLVGLLLTLVNKERAKAA